MTELDDILTILRDLGVCRTQEEYSTLWLGRSPGYFAYLKSANEPPTLSAIGMLIGRLQSIQPDQNASSCWLERARIRTAITMAKTMWAGEWELKNLPAWARVTAI